MKILIIEDNRSLAKTLKNGLKSHFVIDLAHTGRKGIYQAITNEYDAIILDLSLPDTSGYDVCQELRREQIHCPIMVLTGKNTPESKVVMFNTGADDYVVKPFDLAVLKARLHALMRRKNTNSDKQAILEFGPLVLNPQTRTVFCRQQPLQLRKKEYFLLQYLIIHQNTPINHLRLFEHIWDGNSLIASNTVAVHIYNLRKKISQKWPNQLIKTIHGFGYIMQK
jgi:two-component system response regulator CiaR